jgi:hypothetical protein
VAFWSTKATFKYAHATPNQGFSKCINLCEATLAIPTPFCGLMMSLQSRISTHLATVMLPMIGGVIFCNSLFASLSKICAMSDSSNHPFGPKQCTRRRQKSSLSRQKFDSSRCSKTKRNLGLDWIHYLIHFIETSSKSSYFHNITFADNSKSEIVG